jgi:hypothetical protein
MMNKVNSWVEHEQTESETRRIEKASDFGCKQHTLKINIKQIKQTW